MCDLNECEVSVRVVVKEVAKGGLVLTMYPCFYCGKPRRPALKSTKRSVA